MTTRQLKQAFLTPVLFAPAGIGDVLWTPTSTPLANGRISNVLDLGASPRPTRYAWFASTRWAATPAANDRLSFYLIDALAAADPTRTVGAFTPGDANLTTENELLANARPIGVVLATAVDKLFLSCGLVEIPQRYVCLAAWNGSATKALSATDSDHWFQLTPIVDELQNEV